MGLLSREGDGEPLPAERLHDLVSGVARSQKELARSLKQIKQLIADHPELDVPAQFRGPHLIIDHGTSRWQRRFAASRAGKPYEDDELWRRYPRHRFDDEEIRRSPRRLIDDDGPDAA